MLKEDYFLRYEMKAGRVIKIGTGMPFGKFKQKYGTKIIGILESLWGQQFDLITRNRVLEAIRLQGIPDELLDGMNRNVDAWIKEKFIPTYTKAVIYAADGDSEIIGMADSINQALGASIIFNPSTRRMIDYINKEGANLAVELTNNQLLSLKTILKHAIQNDWSNITTYSFMKKGITLTPREIMWLENFYNRSFKNALEEIALNNPTLKGDALLRAATRVAENKVNDKFLFYQRSRAQRIATTELIRAKGEGDIEAHQQAIDAGIISAAEKQWERQNFKDNWETSILYDGQRIGLDESFAQFGIPVKTTMVDFRMPGEINEHCEIVFYARR
jgi:hypothetical protein